MKPASPRLSNPGSPADAAKPGGNPEVTKETKNIKTAGVAAKRARLQVPMQAVCLDTTQIEVSVLLDTGSEVDIIDFLQETHKAILKHLLSETLCIWLE